MIRGILTSPTISMTLNLKHPFWTDYFVYLRSLKVMGAFVMKLLTYLIRP